MKMNYLGVGRIRRAPEGFLGPEGIKTVFREARSGRRDFLRNAFAAAAAGAAVPAALAQGNPVPAAGGDSNILELPEHTRGLGQGVASEGYGRPSKYTWHAMHAVASTDGTFGCTVGIIRFTNAADSIPAVMSSGL